MSLTNNNNKLVVDLPTREELIDTCVTLSGLRQCTGYSSEECKQSDKGIEERLVRLNTMVGMLVDPLSDYHIFHKILSDREVTQMAQTNMGFNRQLAKHVRARKMSKGIVEFFKLTHNLTKQTKLLPGIRHTFCLYNGDDRTAVRIQINPVQPRYYWAQVFKMAQSDDISLIPRSTVFRQYPHTELKGRMLALCLAGFTLDALCENILMAYINTGHFPPGMPME